MSKIRWFILIATVAMLGALFTSAVAYAQEDPAGENGEGPVTPRLYLQEDKGYQWTFDYSPGDTFRECIEDPFGDPKYKTQDDCKKAYPYTWYADEYNEYGGGCIKVHYGGNYKTKQDCEDYFDYYFTYTWIFDQETGKCVEDYDTEYYKSKSDCQRAHPYQWYYDDYKRECVNVQYGGQYKSKSDCEDYN